MVDPNTISEAFRDKAARCRRLARQTSDREVAERLLELACEFEQQAEKAAKGEL